MSHQGVKTAKVLSVILAAAMIINSTQTACASSQAAFDVSAEEEQVLLEEAGSLGENEVPQAPSDEVYISGGDELIDDEPEDHELSGDELSGIELEDDDDEFTALQEENIVPVEAAEAEEDTSNSFEELQVITEEELYNKLGDAELEAAEEITLTEEEIEVKAALVENEVLSDLLEMEEGRDYVEDQVIALASDNEEAQLIAAAYGGELTDFSYGIATISLKDSELTVLEAFEYGINPETGVPAVEPDYLLSFDGWDSEAAGDDAEFESWENQYYLVGHNDPLLNPADSRYQWHHEAIGCFDAWDVSLGKSDITVAVIDSGVQTDHEDLKDAIVDNYEQVNKDTAAIGLNDSNDDGYGHGTHVAGIVAASIGNGVGGAGVAPGVRILPLNVCKPGAPGSPVVSYMVKAIQYVAGAVDVNNATYYNERRADIINMSIGSNTYNAAMKKAVDAAYAQGVTIVAAMGNDGSHLVKFPARYDHVIGVCATREDNTLTDFSDYGEWADISAPGLGIYSSAMGSGNTYVVKNGTSMASPVVAGACALYMSYMGHVTPDSMEEVLKATSTQISQSNAGAGVVNVARMLGKTPSVQKPDSANPPIDVIILDKTAVSLSSPAGGVSEVADLRITSLINENEDQVMGTDIVKYTSFKWTSSDETVARISGISEGKALTSVTVVPVSSGKATITCQVLDRSGRKAACKVKVVSDKAITEIHFASYSDNDYITRDASGRVKSVILFNGSKESDVDLYASQSTRDGDLDDYIKAPVFKNSNPKVVRIDQIDDSGKSIRVTALSKGTAKIKAVAADGSGKSATVTIKVRQPAIGVEVSGQRYVIPGKKAAFKARVYPSNANNKKVIWEVGEDTGSDELKAVPGISINSKGVVSVSKSIAYRGTIRVKAVLQDDAGVCDMASFTISARTDSVLMYNKSDGTSGNGTTLGVGDVGIYKSTMTLVGAAYSSDSKLGREVTFTSSNPNVVIVDEINYDSDTGKTTAVVRARKKGKATITCKALDGSNKSKKISLKVVTPVSSLSLITNDNLTGYIAYGGSTQLTAALGKVYGTPSNQEIIWDYDIVAYKDNGGSERLSETDPQLLETIKKNKSFFSFSKGKIKVNSREKFKSLIEKYGYEGSVKKYIDFGIVVSVSTTDGSELTQESGIIRAIEPCSRIDFYPYKSEGTGSDKKYIWSDEKTDKLVIDLADDSSNPVVVRIEQDSEAFGATKYPVKISCSNTGIASCFYGSLKTSPTGLIVYPYRTGTCDIKLTVRDGSGFSRVLTVEVIDSSNSK